MTYFYRIAVQAATSAIVGLLVLVATPVPVLARLATPGVKATPDAPLTLNVKKYGAVGNGTTDDSLAIRRANEAARAGQTLYFPKGTYLLSRPLHAKAGVTYLGDGSAQTRLLASKRRWGWRLTETAMLLVMGQDAVTVKDLTLDASGRNRGSGNGCGWLVINNSQRGRFISVNFHDSGQNHKLTSDEGGAGIYIIAHDPGDKLPEFLGTRLQPGDTSDHLFQRCVFTLDPETVCAFAVRVMSDPGMQSELHPPFTHFADRIVIDQCRFEGTERGWFWNHVEFFGAGTRYGVVKSSTFSGPTLGQIDFDKGTVGCVAEGNTLTGGGYPDAVKSVFRARVTAAITDTTATAAGATRFTIGRGHLLQVGDHFRVPEHMVAAYQKGLHRVMAADPTAGTIDTATRYAGLGQGRLMDPSPTGQSAAASVSMKGNSSSHRAQGNRAINNTIKDWATPVKVSGKAFGSRGIDGKVVLQVDKATAPYLNHGIRPGDRLKVTGHSVARYNGTFTVLDVGLTTVRLDLRFTRSGDGGEWSYTESTPEHVNAVRIEYHDQFALVGNRISGNSAGDAVFLGDAIDGGEIKRNRIRGSRRGITSGVRGGIRDLLFQGNEIEASKEALSLRALDGIRLKSNRLVTRTVSGAAVSIIAKAPVLTDNTVTGGIVMTDTVAPPK